MAAASGPCSGTSARAMLRDIFLSAEAVSPWCKWGLAWSANMVALKLVVYHHFFIQNVILEVYLILIHTYVAPLS